MYKKLAEGSGQAERLWPLRASGYQLRYEARFGGLPQHVESEHEASWRREDPLGSYVAVARGREPRAGAHVGFMNLKQAYFEQNRHRFEQELKRFADAHGLLGTFFERFPTMTLPEGKDLVAPNSGLDSKTGKLKSIDPATKGKKHLSEEFRRRYGRFRTYDQTAGPVLKRGLGDRTGLPHELSFMPMTLVPTFGRLGPSGGSASLTHEALPWEEAEGDYGLRVILDKHEEFGVALLPTREPVFDWERELEGFPSGEDLTADNGYALGNINVRKAAAPSLGYVGEDGRIRERWRCPTLLAALYVMLWLDVREGRSFPRCRLQDCGRYFRKGPQDTTVYCGVAHADLARQRRRRASKGPNSPDPS